jgi:Ca2+-binding RTX toxin-like protein
MAFFVEMAIGADLDGDGLTDLPSVQSGFARDEDVSVALGVGGGLFAPSADYDTGIGHRDIEASDLDGDGDLDLAVSDSNDATTLLFNDGSGALGDITTYQGELIFTGGNQAAIEVGDLNGDGALDLVAADVQGNDIGVHFGRGDGSFDEHQLRYGMNLAPADVELADMNGDGLLDVVLPNQALTGGATPGGAMGSPTAPGDGSGGGVSVALNRRVPGGYTLSGSSRNDVLTGTSGNDRICGLGGHDTIDGRGGNDVLLGGDGNDTLRGGTGADRLFGEAGFDTLYGRDRVSGNDRLDGGRGADRCSADLGDKITAC